MIDEQTLANWLGEATTQTVCSNGHKLLVLVGEDVVPALVAEVRKLREEIRLLNDTHTSVSARAHYLMKENILLSGELAGVRLKEVRLAALMLLAQNPSMSAETCLRLARQNQSALDGAFPFEP